MVATDVRKLTTRFKTAYWILYIIGGLTVGLGIITELFQVSVLRAILGNGWIVAAEGAIVLVLGYFTMRRSLLALGIAIGLYAVDAVLTVLAYGLQGVVVRVVILVFLVRGFLALQELRRVSASAPPAAGVPTV